MSEARAAKKFPLLAPSLAGLSRFAHLISVEYFSDLLAVMVQVCPECHHLNPEALIVPLVCDSLLDTRSSSYSKFEVKCAQKQGLLCCWSR
jgi:hypothetical protein